jgi:pimeloyl-ACP methyl ester carboxylesterase
MDRRDVLKSALSLAAGTGSRDSMPSAMSQTPGRSVLTRDARAPFIETRDGQQLFFKDWGNGTPVVFLAAWALPSAMWDYQMAPLSERGMRCVAYDRRGHGRSSQPGAGYDYDTLADDLAAVLDTLDLRRVTLVGMSMAGGEMVRYVTRHGPARVARLVFVGTSATPFLMQTADNPTGIPAERFESFRRNVLLRDYPKWLEENRQPFFVPETSPQMQEWVRSMMLTTSMKAIVECNRSMTTTDFRTELPKIKIPALVIHGDKDVSAILDRTGRPTADMMPRAELKVYEGAPHGLFLTHMSRLADDISSFATA